MLRDTETLWLLVAIWFLDLLLGPVSPSSCWHSVTVGGTRSAQGLADSGAALEPWLMRGGQLGLQCQSRQGPLQGSCAAQAQGHFQRAGRDTGYQLSEILVTGSQENPTVPALCGA